MICHTMLLYNHRISWVLALWSTPGVSSFFVETKNLDLSASRSPEFLGHTVETKIPSDDSHTIYQKEWEKYITFMVFFIAFHCFSSSFIFRFSVFSLQCLQCLCYVTSVVCHFMQKGIQVFLRHPEPPEAAGCGAALGSRLASHCRHTFILILCMYVCVCVCMYICIRVCGFVVLCSVFFSAGHPWHCN